uniref:C-type lectin domain-containing protein n=1 Tax=Caenorhabditis tropicalis TaxID=1561998 RepID=A0A1I7U1F4_9PELO
MVSILRLLVLFSLLGITVAIFDSFEAEQKGRPPRPPKPPSGPKPPGPRPTNRPPTNPRPTGQPPSGPRPTNRPRPTTRRPGQARGCEHGWMAFNRPQGTWCVKVFYGPHNWHTSQIACKLHGAVLTGFQNANERIQVANAGRALSFRFGGGPQEMWVDGMRRPECQTKEACDPLNAFQWTDGHTTGTDGFFWPGQEPNALYTPKRGVQSAIMMHISPADGIMARFGLPHGSLTNIMIGLLICMLVFQVGGANRETAELLCKGHGATLTGVQDANENMQIAADAVRAYNQNPAGYGDVWLGARRKPECYPPMSCPPLSAFEWTDGHTTGNYFFWGPGEPNALLYQNLGPQTCAVQLVSNCCPLAKYGYPHGSFDDVHCETQFYLYACGKKPS